MTPLDDTPYRPVEKIPGRVAIEHAVLDRWDALGVTDRVDAAYPPDEAETVAAFGDWIRGQTLARSLTPGTELNVERVAPGSAGDR